MANPSNSLPIHNSLVSDTKSLAKAIDIPWRQWVAMALRDD
ncbi:MAG: hypothetical protein AAFV90_17775 [Cyanobacteria bacterium J06634_5]